MVYILVNLLNAEVVLNHINSAIPMQQPTHTHTHTLITVLINCILTVHMCDSCVSTHIHTPYTVLLDHTHRLWFVCTHMCTRTHTLKAVSTVLYYWSLEHAGSCTLNRHTSEDAESVIDRLQLLPTMCMYRYV